MANQPRIGAIELGGTKSIAVLASGREIIDQRQFDTCDPATTLSSLISVLKVWHDEAPFDAIGIGSFGSVSLDPGADDYGCIRTTPKPGWSGAAIIPALRQHFQCPIGIETDVTAAGLAEYRWGAATGCSSLCYITIGTGVGGGILIGGEPVRGRLHPEVGHVTLRRHPGDGFAGICAFHGDCAEGLLSGPALKARFGTAVQNIAADDPRWIYPTHDLAQLLAALIFMVAPQKILVGGGVGMGAPNLVQRARELIPNILGGYFPDIGGAELEVIISAPGLGELAGPLGAVAVGMRAVKTHI